eukprot:3341585-Pyramimonas_sp.AAC.1
MTRDAVSSKQGSNTAKWSAKICGWVRRPPCGPCRWGGRWGSLWRHGACDGCASMGAAPPCGRCP